jgi:hypothetical protein
MANQNASDLEAALDSALEWNDAPGETRPKDLRIVLQARCIEQRR